MTKEELELYNIPKNHRSLKVCLNNNESLFEFLSRERMSVPEFDFDITCKKPDVATWGLERDINESLKDILLHIKMTDVYAAYYFKAGTNWVDYYRFILKFKDVDELRSVLNERRRIGESCADTVQ